MTFSSNITRCLSSLPSSSMISSSSSSSSASHASSCSSSCPSSSSAFSETSSSAALANTLGPMLLARNSSLKTPAASCRPTSRTSSSASRSNNGPRRSVRGSSAACFPATSAQPRPVLRRAAPAYAWKRMIKDSRHRRRGSRTAHLLYMEQQTHWAANSSCDSWPPLSRPSASVWEPSTSQAPEQRGLATSSASASASASAFAGGGSGSDSNRQGPAPEEPSSEAPQLPATEGLPLLKETLARDAMTSVPWRPGVVVVASEQPRCRSLPHVDPCSTRPRKSSSSSSSAKAGRVRSRCLRANVASPPPSTAAAPGSTAATGEEAGEAQTSGVGGGGEPEPRQRRQNTPRRTLSSSCSNSKVQA
mmetsp:Transcript_177628/g.563551  ORF Transcript_177628/g.563551 Transcript_177628/m.563551 type:complete len:362 (+) Transcript_177628:614-1699(+)